VANLARETARNTTLLQTQLSGFAAQQRTVTESRIANLMRLQRDAADAEGRRARNAAIDRSAGLADEVDLYEALRQRAIDSAREHGDAEAALADARKALEGRVKTIEVRSGALQDTTKSLLSISKSLSFKQYAALLFKFGSEVADDVKKAQADAKKANATADKKSGDAKNTVTAGQ